MRDLAGKIAQLVETPDRLLVLHTVFFEDHSNHSRLSAMIGSIRVALRAGM